MLALKQKQVLEKHSRFPNLHLPLDWQVQYLMQVETNWQERDELPPTFF